MINHIKQWLKRREDEYDFVEKARLCKPCEPFCGKSLCKKVGCLNMDMRTNSIRLSLLVKRLEEAGYEFRTKENPSTEDPSNIVNLDDFRK